MWAGTPIGGAESAFPKTEIATFRRLIIQYSLGFDTRRFPERPRLDPSHPYCLWSRGATGLRRSGFRLDRDPEPLAPQFCFPSPFAILGCAAAYASSSLALCLTLLCRHFFLTYFSCARLALHFGQPAPLPA